MNLEIITPEKTLYKGEVILVQLPGLDGSFEVLERHAPLISVLAKGKVKVQDDKKETLFFISTACFRYLLLDTANAKALITL